VTAGSRGLSSAPPTSHFWPTPSWPCGRCEAWSNRTRCSAGRPDRGALLGHAGSRPWQRLERLGVRPCRRRRPHHGAALLGSPERGLRRSSAATMEREPGEAAVEIAEGSATPGCFTPCSTPSPLSCDPARGHGDRPHPPDRRAARAVARGHRHGPLRGAVPRLHASPGPALQRPRDGGRHPGGAVLALRPRQGLRHLLVPVRPELRPADAARREAAPRVRLPPPVRVAALHPVRDRLAARPRLQRRHPDRLRRAGGPAHPVLPRPGPANPLPGRAPPRGCAAGRASPLPGPRHCRRPPGAAGPDERGGRGSLAGGLGGRRARDRPLQRWPGLPGQVGVPVRVHGAGLPDVRALPSRPLGRAAPGPRRRRDAGSTRSTGSSVLAAASA